MVQGIKKKTAARDTGAIEFARYIAAELDQRKADDIIILDMRTLSAVSDFFIIASGKSRVHLQSMAKNIIEYAREGKWDDFKKPLHYPHDVDNDWSLIDFGAVMIHLFMPKTRSFYNLEKLWSDAGRIVPGENL